MARAGCSGACVTRQGVLVEGKCLWLLADACSLKLRPDSQNEPFGVLQSDGRRTILPDEFSQEEIGLLADAVDHLDHDLLRARVADLLWITSRPRNVLFAFQAIDAYARIKLTKESWVTDARDCWERALVLARQLSRGAIDRVELLEKELLSIFDQSAIDEPSGFFQLTISELLLRHGLARADAKRIAHALYEHAVAQPKPAGFREARNYFAAAASWYTKAGEKDLSYDCLARQAESFSEEADFRMDGGQGGNLVAQSFYEDAIQTFRKIPRKQREDRGIQGRLEELHQRLKQAGVATIDEMAKISAGPVDVSESVQLVQDAIRGKSFVEALRTFSLLHQIRRRKIEDQAKKAFSTSPLKALFSGTHLASDGRVVAKRPGIGFGSTDTPEYEAGLWSEMLSQYGFEIGFVTQVQILPALYVLAAEHRVRLDDIREFVAQSPFVQGGRIEAFSRGIYAGFENEWFVAVHVLVPQIEHIVRHHMQARGIKTSTVDGDGIETENGLSRLLEASEIVEIFGEDIAFELKALFSETQGPNLRNNIAHGLLDDRNFRSADVVYAWWVIFAWIFRGYLLQTKQLNA